MLRLPIAHGEGCYFADERTLDELEAEDRVVFRYLDNPNGSLRDIAGILSRERNVMGMMPHPERASRSADGVDRRAGGLRVACCARRCRHERRDDHTRTDRATPVHARRIPQDRRASWGASRATPNWAFSA